MQATLTFNIPEESVEHLAAMQGGDWKSVAWNMDAALRGYLKRGHNFKTPDEVLDELRAELHGMMEDRGLILD